MKRVLVALAAFLGVTIPVITHADQPEPPLVDLRSGTACPLGRVAMVRGRDSEARDGGGFEAARSDWGKLGKTVVLDHLDGGHTIYGHLHTVDVSLNSNVTAGQMIGTIGYSGNAGKLRAKGLPPHLHFGYVRGFVPLARIRDSGDNVLAGVTGVLHPIWAVRFLKCWENPLPVGAPSLPSTLICVDEQLVPPVERVGFAHFF